MHTRNEVNDVLSATRKQLRVHVLPRRSAPARNGSQWKESTMGLPYRDRVDERWYLYLPGVSSTEAYVFAFVEDTSGSDLRSDPSPPAAEATWGGAQAPPTYLRAHVNPSKWA
jgi:hypothetical protein